jgi:ubiquinone/menaquinone biosynthesis C-methylase UbiE
MAFRGEFMNKSKSCLRIFLKVLGVFVLYQIVLRLIRKVWRFPAPAFIGRFLDSDYRRTLQPPGPIVARSGAQPGMKVLEIGCGSGAYTTFFARAVASGGEVAALDIQPAMLAQLAAKLAKPENQDIHNIVLHEASAYELPFDDNTLDLVYMITVFQEIPDRDRTLAEALRVLKPGGLLAITEWLFDPDYPLMSTTIKQGTRAGFAVDAVLGNWWTYTVRFKKVVE